MHTVRFFRHVTLLTVTALVIAAILNAENAFAQVQTEGDAVFNGQILVAQNGGDGTLTIIGPTVVQGGEILVASDPDTRGTVIIDGATFNGDGSFEIGQSGDGSLEILNGGSVSGDRIEVASSGGSGSVLVSGSGSTLDMPSGSAIIGGIFEGIGFLTIENGGQVNHGIAGIAALDRETAGGGFGNVVITGENSRWDVDGNFTFHSGVLRISEGGQFNTNRDFNNRNSTVEIGLEGGSGLVIVEGIGSLWQDRSETGIGVGTGGQGTVAIRDSGNVSSNSLVLGDSPLIPGGFNTDGEGLVTIDGLGSTWTTSSLRIANGEVQLTNGGRLINSTEPRIETIIGSNGNGRLVVDGSTSQWVDQAEEIFIGDGGNGELVIRNGARVTNLAARLASDQLGNGNNLSTALVRVEGEGSLWSVQFLFANEFSEGIARLEIRDRAVVDVGNSLEVGPNTEIILDQGTLRGPDFDRFFSDGTIVGSGQIQSSLSNRGTLRVNPGDRLVISGELENEADRFRGGIEVNNGELEVRGNFINSSSGAANFENATLRVTGDSFFDNTGTVNLIGGENRIEAQFFDNRNYLNVTGGINLIDANLLNTFQIILTANSQTTFLDRVDNSGDIRVSAGSTATFLGPLFGNGTSGGGTVFLEGNISPGFSPGTMQFGGDIALGDFSQLNIEIGQDAHDALDVTGSASVSGDLVLSALSALDGDTVIEILSADAVIGTFSDLPDIGDELGFGVVFGGISYTDDSVEVSLLQQSGDFTGDGSVDGADLDAWQAGFGSFGGAILDDGDAERDGDVDGSDFLAWQRAAQTTEPIAANQAVPEPSSLAILFVAMALASARRQ